MNLWPPAALLLCLHCTCAFSRIHARTPGLRALNFQVNSDVHNVNLLPRPPTPSTQQMVDQSLQPSQPGGPPLTGDAARAQHVAPAEASYMTRQLLRSLRLCASCHDFERFGEDHDGGYVMCADGLSDGSLVAAYSYGTDSFDSWGMQLAERYHIPVFEYHCQNATLPTPCNGCEVHFSQECLIGAKETPSSFSDSTLDQTVARNGHLRLSKRSLLLKVDVGGAEWRYFPTASVSTLQLFRQIVIEFHGFEKEEEHGDYLQTVKKLWEAGFVPLHLHGNNDGDGYVSHYGKYSIADNLEVTWVTRPENMTKCPTDLPYYLPEEDAPNDPWKPELGIPKLPRPTPVPNKTGEWNR